MFKSQFFKNYSWILGAAILARLIAVIFSPGYGMHDDHFLIIESSASWVDGYDYNAWLPWTEGNRGGPEGHSFTYVGLNFLYFWFMKAIGVVDPSILMMINRFIHALASMFVVVYGIKITEKLSNPKNAKIVGWLLALLWIMPFVSVRNLVETAAIPFIVLGVWLAIRERKMIDFLWAGFLLGFAVSFRYQIGVFAIGMAAIYFFQFKWKPFFLFCAGVLIVFGLTQGLVDFFIWGRPFAELITYVVYNMNEGTAYLQNQNYFMYFLVLIGSLLFPFGLLMFAGFIRSWKKYMILFVPTLIFILFHTIYPNRQERFILSVLPFFIILGVIGFDLFKQTNFKEKAWKYSWIIFWILNIPILLFASTMYSKKSRVEAMRELYANEMHNEHILLEGTASGSVSMMPKFYAKEWHCAFNNRTDSTALIIPEESDKFDYIFFFDEEKLAKRISNYKAIYPNMQLAKKCNPSSLDVLLRKMNPRNANEYIEVWKTNRK